MGGASSPQVRRGLLSAMKLLMFFIFLGYLMVWVLFPTNLWRNNWKPNVENHTNSTFFGKQGTYLVIYTVPLLFIAALGCVYVHLKKKGGRSLSKGYGENSSVSAWKRPVLVKGPLGVVSALELAFLTIFLALLLWTLCTRLKIRFSEINRGNLQHRRDPKHIHDKRWQLKLRSSAYILGLVGNICCAFLFFPVTRRSSILALLGLTSDASIKYHIWLGHIALLLFTAHGLGYSLYWAITNDLVQLLKWDKVGVSNVAGEIALAIGITMWIAVLGRIRRQKFELFFYTHQLYSLFLLFYLLHVGITFFALVLPGVYLFLIDRYLRFLQSRHKARLISACILPCEAVQLNFSRSPGLVYTPTSVVFINVPSISPLQWHPFTVISNCDLESDILSIVIKKEGSWSQELFQMFSSPLDRLDVSVDGPYGPSAVDLLRHDTLALLSGGSGITPIISIFRELMFASASLTSPSPTILIIAAFKSYSDLTMLDLLLPSSTIPADFSHLNFRLAAFVTREKEPPTSAHAQNVIRTIRFKPHPAHQPITPVLGPNSWLWLGVVICTSFIGFLIVLGLSTRFYIYPIDHNTDTNYPMSSRALLNMLFICLCIALAASAAVLWNKRKYYSREVNQIQNLEMETQVTMTLPSPWLGFSDQGLENRHSQLVLQNTSVHYGSRPNLKMMLREIKGTNVGVLVSGPKEMRDDVASICSSSHANHLHFEAFSFNW